MDVSRVLDLVRPFFESRAQPFDLGLCPEDELAMREARLRPLVVDRAAALELIANAGVLVDAAVRQRPLFSGAPFKLPGHVEEGG